ncbi:carboxylic ester hydrolase-like [Anticarsia gemmatalis]|uniref:carboxylic ester hydrolase-like n=1 Tax=Anticarsia gemmatalis TaxID=129554 RepID=UPI003F773A35
MLRYLLFLILLVNVFARETEEKIVELDVGVIRGEKYWNGDFFEFYGVPYATVPTGRDRYKAPLPLEPFGSINAKVKNINCPQIYLTEEEEEEKILDGVEDCLRMNILVPTVASEKNLLPVLVYIHSGAYSGGNGNMALFHHLPRHDIITISFNYRLGALGFACLGTEEIPGNAALKDQVAALKFIKKYIKKFGGNPKKITVAGFSVGATMAELLTLSKTTDGLIDKLILESGSALSPFAINRHPIKTAKNLAISLGFNNTGDIKDLTEFLLNADIKGLAIKSKNFFLPNSTFGLAPCIEKVIENTEPFLTESPLTILQRGDYKKIPILTGFSNMEGISRTLLFNEWSDMMNDNFADFLPADLKFDSVQSRDEFISEIKKTYFKGEEVSHNTLKEYVDYFSDSMFKYAIMKSAKLHSLKSNRPVFVYEFTYVGKLNMKHNYMDRLKGATHRDQTAYLLDFFDHTTSRKDMDTRDRMTTMWTDFAKYENPTAYESLILDVKWLNYTTEEQNYLEIGHKLRMKKDLFAKRYLFWDRIYNKYYWNPLPVGESVKKTKK